MRNKVIALLVTLFAALGFATATPALAAGGYVLNDAQQVVLVTSSRGTSHAVYPGQSSSLYMIDADKIYVARNYCIALDGRRIGYAGGTYIPVRDGSVVHVTSYGRC